jgi:hypothetical protein
VGLDIRADTPEGIALSIVAEIQAALAGHRGGMLRHRPGPIHSAVLEVGSGGPVADCERELAVCSL